MKTLDFKNYQMRCLDTLEERMINGGGTDFAFDIGTALRFTWQKVNNDFGGQAMTIYKWCIANGK